MQSIIKWIGENKEWLFSGLGIAIAGIMLRILWVLFHRKKMRESRKQQKAGRDIHNLENVHVGSVFNISVDKPTKSEQSYSKSIPGESKQVRPILRIIGIEDGSRFYRTVASATDNRDKDTLVCLKVRIINNGSISATIARYELNIPSLGYREELQPIPEKEKVRYRTGESTSVWLGISSLANHEGPIRIDPNGDLKTGNLYFRIPHILLKEMRELVCELNVWDYNDYSAFCEVKLTKEGY